MVGRGATGEAADAFLGTQGDLWDTQWDMFLALCGAIAAQLLVGRWHDRLLEDHISTGGTPAGPVTLREITAANIDLVGEVRVVGEQRFHVASVGKTFWQAMRARRRVDARDLRGRGARGLRRAAACAASEIYLARPHRRLPLPGPRLRQARRSALVLEQARSLPGCDRVTLSHVPSNAARRAPATSASASATPAWSTTKARSRCGSISRNPAPPRTTYPVHPSRKTHETLRTPSRPGARLAARASRRRPRSRAARPRGGHVRGRLLLVHGAALRQAARRGGDDLRLHGRAARRIPRTRRSRRARPATPRSCRWCTTRRR